MDDLYEVLLYKAAVSRELPELYRDHRSEAGKIDINKKKLSIQATSSVSRIAM